MGNFLSDLDRSQKAVAIVKTHFESKGFEVNELEKARQKEGDLEVTGPDCIVGCVEVKYDIMAKRTNNLCFEMSNGKKLTGILETKANHIAYVVPSRGCHMVYIFEPTKLKKYLNESPKVVIKNGGDNKRFTLAIVRIHDVVGDGLPEEVFSVWD